MILCLLACAPVVDTAPEARSDPPPDHPVPTVEIPHEPVVAIVDATGDTGDEPHVAQFGTCPPVASDAAELPGTRLVGTYHPAGGATFASQVFTDLDSYAQFLADLGIVGNFVDFRVERAAVFGYAGATSCGFELDGWDAVDAGGTPAVVVRVADTSWGCALDCAGTPSEVWVIAFPKAAMPATCLLVGGGCGPGP